MSMANDLALAISAKLATITEASDAGYQTNIGSRVMRGRKRIDNTHLPCAVLVERDDKPEHKGGTNIKIVQPYIIEGHARCDADNPNDMGHKIIADIKKAIFTDKVFLDDRLVFGPLGARAFTITYVGRSIAPREDGIDVVSAAVEIAVEYVEQLSNP